MVATTQIPQDAHVHDFVTLGFGPAGLAIAIAAEERGLTDYLCLEQQDDFKWHPGMLIPGASMQISFLKDLATLRNPRSEYTFLNYLHSQGRLVKFLNLDTFLPAREEYQDYMHWAARRVGRHGNVQYSTRVVTVEPTSDRQAHRVVAERKLPNGKTEEQSLYARNVIFCTGGQPSLPRSFPKHERLVHTSRFLDTVEQIKDKTWVNGFAVIGGGQSAAETWTHLGKIFPASKVEMLFRSSALKPSDDSPFVNEVFDPSSRVDQWFKMPEERRSALIKECRQTNYSVVRLTLLEEMYKHLYTQELPGHSKPHALRPNTQVEAFDIREDGSVTIHSRDTAKEEQCSDTYDFVFCATGYQRNFHVEALKNFDDVIYREDGRPDCTRLYRVRRESEQDKAAGAGIYLQGLTESSHGLAESLLSILATRGMEVVEDMMRTTGLRPASKPGADEQQSFVARLEETSDYESERTSTPEAN